MILNDPSSDTMARWRRSGENSNALTFDLETCQYETGFVFWFLELTDFLIVNSFFSFFSPSLNPSS